MKYKIDSLSNAIVLQAATDYRNALKVLKQQPRNQIAKGTKTECERFFRSAWYTKLTKVDGELLLSQLNKEVA